MTLSTPILSRDPTFLGEIAEVSGGRLNVHLAPSVASGLSVIAGQIYSIGQVGSFVLVPQGYQELFGVILAIGASAVPEHMESVGDTGRWMRVELVGEVVGGQFERGIGQYPNVGDAVHLATEDQLRSVYDGRTEGYITIGSLSNADSILARISIDELVTRHSAVLGSTGSGKSTTVASLLRSITARGSQQHGYPSARILLLDVHGEYAEPLEDVADVFSVDPQRKGHRPLYIPYWALEPYDLLTFLTGGVKDNQETAFTDKITELKRRANAAAQFPGVRPESITLDAPIPFSLKQLWHDLIDFEIATFEGKQRNISTRQSPGNAETLTRPIYKPHAMGAAGPFLNQQAIGVQRQLNLLRSRLLDKRYDFLLHPGPWEPDLKGAVQKDLDVLLDGWLGGDKPITVLDLSGVPSGILERLVGSILRVIYEALFWSREKTEGGFSRPLLVVMEEGHRYLSDEADGPAGQMIQRIAKEGRKYGVGAMVVSQRPSEVNETVLSQCGTFFALRLTNPVDRGRIQGTLPDGLVGLLDLLPILRTGEAIVAGEAARLPMRCRITLPPVGQRPQSEDPDVSTSWRLPRRREEYARVVASWRAQNPLAVADDVDIERIPVEDESSIGD